MKKSLEMEFTDITPNSRSDDDQTDVSIVDICEGYFEQIHFRLATYISYNIETRTIQKWYNDVCDIFN